jgi:uncharacterized Zn-finger protein
MICKYWKSEDNFCVKKMKTINYDDLATCAEFCSYFSRINVENLLTCPNCFQEFNLTKNNVIRIGQSEHIKCPYCDSIIDVKPDDEALSE